MGGGASGAAYPLARSGHPLAASRAVSRQVHKERLGARQNPVQELLWLEQSNTGISAAAIFAECEILVAVADDQRMRGSLSVLFNAVDGCARTWLVLRH